MKKLVSHNIKKVLLFVLLSLIPNFVYATTANINIEGGTVIVGNTITVTFQLKSVDTSLVSFGGYLNFDSNYLSLNSCSSSSILGLNFNNSNNKFAFVDNSVTGIESGKIGICIFKANKVGTTHINISNPSGTDNSTNHIVNVTGGTITIKDKPSSNNKLSSLSISNGTISFSPSTTNYNVSVESSVSSINVSASAEDSKAKISGTGNVALNYGSNNINVIVTAEDGSTKTYTIKVDRKDERSSNNNLSSLSVSSGKLSPSFDKNKTSYKIDVPYSVSKLDIDAKAEDSKSKVSINSPNLVAESTTTVKVVVTAENGSTKTYTIEVSRGKDPNKKLSNDNYLKSLSVSVGMLSPSFDKEKVNYAVYLPYEISTIDINVEVEDTKYAKVTKEENNNLSIGNNLFKYTVTAEDNSTRTYIVTVVRNKSLEDIDSTTNTYLKNIVLDNGNLIGKFNKEKNTYYYNNKNKNISISKAEPEIEENTVSIYNEDNTFIVMVETPSGERGFYILLESKENIFPYILLGVGIITAGIIGVIFYKKKKNNKSGEVK